MRILLVVHGFPPSFTAGAERRAERMAQWFVSHHHEVQVVAVESLEAPGFSAQAKIENGFVVHRLYYDVNESGNPFQALYEYAPVEAFLSQLIQDNSFDLIHIVSGYLLGLSAIRVGRQFGLPLVLTLTDYWFMCARINLVRANDELCAGPVSMEVCTRCLMEHKRRYRWPAIMAPNVMDQFWAWAHRQSLTQKMRETVSRRQTLLNQALHEVDLIISPSHHLIEKFADFDFDIHRFIQMRQGVNHTFNEAPVSTSHHPLRLGFFGQIKPHKGLDLAIRAVMMLIDEGEQVCFDFAGPTNGQANYLDSLNKLITNYPSIRWHGNLSTEKMQQTLHEMDAIIVPSRWYENSPTIILEAFSAGLPVVTANLGGMAELVEHGKNGLLFNYDDANDLYCQLKRLIEEPDLLPRLRDGVPEVKTIDDEMRELMQYYANLLGKPGNSQNEGLAVDIQG